MAIEHNHSTEPHSSSGLDVGSVRRQFPALTRQINERPIIYLDSAATYLTPSPVIDSVTECLRRLPGTVGRGVYGLNTEATELYQAARETVADFINAEPDEIVFLRNATEAINTVANGLPTGATVLASVAEHHSNLLPWRRRHQLTQVHAETDGSLDLSHLENETKTQRPALIACSTITNAAGAINPVQEVMRIARAHDAEVLLDASQSAGHETIDVQQLGCDYLCFSSHKIGGPSGIGVLYAKRERLANLQPMLVGGGSVQEVDLQGHVPASPPECFEAGTPAFESAIGFAAACEFLDELGRDRIRCHEQALTEYSMAELAKIPSVSIVGPTDASKRGPIVAFHVDGVEAHGTARMLSARANICVRSGFHCAQPGHQSLGWRPTLRASLGVYNTRQEIDVLAECLRSIAENLS